MQMSKAGTKGWPSSEESVATINNGLSENLDVELSQRTDRVGEDGEETEGEGVWRVGREWSLRGPG